MHINKKEETMAPGAVDDESRSVDHHSDHSLQEELQALIFPKRLMAVLGEESNQDAIRWSDDGKSFVIVDRKLFVETVMPKFSPRKSKFSSFLRKLNRW